MPKSKYPDDLRERALSLYIDAGVKAAALETGVPAKTISTWAWRAGLAEKASEKRQKAVVRSQEEFALARERIKVKLQDRAEWALDSMDREFTEVVVDQKGFEHAILQRPKPADVKNYATTAGIILDKLQLLTGGPTAVINETLNAPDLKALVRNNVRHISDAGAENAGSYEEALAKQNRKNELARQEAERMTQNN
jgi:hypothetical protein